MSFLSGQKPRTSRALHLRHAGKIAVFWVGPDVVRDDLAYLPAVNSPVTDARFEFLIHVGHAPHKAHADAKRHIVFLFHTSSAGLEQFSSIEDIALRPCRRGNGEDRCK